MSPAINSLLPLLLLSLFFFPLFFKHLLVLVVFHLKSVLPFHFIDIAQLVFTNIFSVVTLN